MDAYAFRGPETQNDLAQGSGMATNEEIRKSTLSRFMPASLALMLPSIIDPFLSGTGFDALYYSMVLINIVGLGLGFSGALKLGRLVGSRRRLGGFRAALTGFLSPVALGFGYGAFIAGGDMSTPVLLLTCGAVALGSGALMGVSTFLRRRRPPLPEPRRELPGESLEEWFARVEREAEESIHRLRVAVAGGWTTARERLRSAAAST